MSSKLVEGLSTDSIQVVPRDAECDQTVDSECMPTQTKREPGLSPAQASFALREHATPGHRAALDRRMVYMYGETPLRSYRWLVDITGDVRDVETFRRPVK